MNPYSQQPQSKGRPTEEPIITVAVVKKRKKTHIVTFPNIMIEDVLDSAKRKPLIPNEYEVIDLGVGKYFIEKYMKQYNINKINTI